MALVNPLSIVDTSFNNKNIVSAAQVYLYTADATRKVQFNITIQNAAGNGDYVIYLRHYWGSTGTTPTVILPKTTGAAASGETKIEFSSIDIVVKSGHSYEVMIDGLAGDTAVSGTVQIDANNYSIFDYLSDVVFLATGSVNANALANDAIVEMDTYFSNAHNTGSWAAWAVGYTDPWAVLVPGSYGGGTAGYNIGRLGSGQIITTSVVAQSGDVETYRGDSYLDTDSRRIDWTDTSAAWPVLTGATIVVVIGGDVQFNGTVVTGTGASKKVGVELTATQTLTIPEAEDYGLDFVVRATLSNGSIITLVAGKWKSKNKLVVGS